MKDFKPIKKNRLSKKKVLFLINNFRACIKIFLWHRIRESVYFFLVSSLAFFKEEISEQTSHEADFCVAISLSNSKTF